MSRTSCVAALCLALAVVPGVAAGQNRGNTDSQARRGYQEYDRITDATFAVATDTGGNAVFTVRGGDFSLEKVVSPTGDATIRLIQGKDVVTIAINQSGFQIGRGRRTVRFDPRADDGEGLDAARSLLLGSRAVRSFKRLAASLEDRDETEEDGALAIGALVDGAIVQLLDGDLDAPKRISKRITRKRRAAIRTIKGRAPGTFVDCVGLYEIALLDSWSKFEGCAQESTGYLWWLRDFVYRACEFEWLLRSQQYLWQFVGCFMLPF